MARSYHQLGNLAFLRGDYDEAARQYHASLAIKERLGDQAGMADSYVQFGVLAQYRGDYVEAARQYQASLAIKERLGDQAGMASSYSQMGILEAERGGNLQQAITWHLQALAIRLQLRVPQARIDLRRLAAHRTALGPEAFSRLLNQAADGPDKAETITALINQAEAADTG